MRKLIAIAVVAGAVLAAVWVWRLLFPSDEARIRGLLAEVAESASLKPNTNPLIKLGGANKLAGFFTADAVIEVEGAPVAARAINGREELVQVVTAARVSVEAVKVEFLDVEVTVDPAGQSATAHLTALATVAGMTDPFVQESNLRFVRDEQGWKISRVEPVKTPRLERIR